MGLSMKPQTEDQRDEWADLQAHRMLVLADELVRLLDMAGVDPKVVERVWPLVGVAYRAGRLRPQELAGERSYFGGDEDVQSSGASCA